MSLDTHPANNALVVTYEILVAIVDGASRRELSRRNKRAQFLIQISQFDQLDNSEPECRADRFDLGAISSEIVKRCPLLVAPQSGERSSRRRQQQIDSDEIQLHLLYLLNRRHSSLLAQQTRPASSASLGSQFRRNPSQQRASSKPSQIVSSSYHDRKKSSQLVGPEDGDESAEDIHAFVRKLEARGQACCHDSDLFEVEFDSATRHPEEAPNGPIVDNNAAELENIDTYLEGLYGDRAERLLSLGLIRQLCGRVENLSHIGSNKQLVFALIRNLRDSSESPARQLILCCLLRITSYEDVYLSTFEDCNSEKSKNSSSSDLIRVLCNLLTDYVRNHTNSIIDSANKKDNSCLEEATIRDSNYSYASAILFVLINLLKISKSNPSIKLEQRIFSDSHDPGRSLSAILGDLFELSARDLMREIRLMGKPIKVVQLLNVSILLLRQLSCLQEFILRIRSRNQFFESIVNLLDCLQLIRPGSGKQASSQNSDPLLVRDNQSLKELYHLELNLLMLVNNILMDSRIRARLIKRKLLKPVLRNLVIFLAKTSGDHNNYNYCMNNWANSLILMVPFRSLYELSCDKSVRLELYKSKLIMKCLLEYLLSSVQQDSLLTLEPIDEDGKIRFGASYMASNDIELDWVDGSFSIEPTNVFHYILGVWINLSCHQEAPIYSSGEDYELKASLCEYIDLALDKLKEPMISLLTDGLSSDKATMTTTTTVKTTTKTKMMMTMGRRDCFVMIYLHLKLLRNVSQFMRFANGEDLKFYDAWLSKLGDLSDMLLNSLTTANQWNLKPYLIECIASLGNLIAAKPACNHNSQLTEDDEDDVDVRKQIGEMEPVLASIFGKLIQLKCENFAGEEHDDLLLVSIQLIGFLSNKLEICATASSTDEQHCGAAFNLSSEHINREAPSRQRLGVRILRACNFILDSRLSDYELLIHTLYSLGQLMNHSQFLRSLLGETPEGWSHRDHDDDGAGSIKEEVADEDESAEDEPESNLSELAELLVDKLANLVLYTGVSSPPAMASATAAPAGGPGRERSQTRTGVSRLALDLLNVFRQLEQQTSIESSFVHKVRFANYNSKWLAAIQASREALESPSSSAAAATMAATRSEPIARAQAATQPNGFWFDNENDDYGDDDELLFGGNDDDDDFGGRLPSGAASQHPMEPMMEEDESQLPSASSDSSNSGSGLEAPDLNVIEPSSMIKHLSSRRQLRRHFSRS